MPSSFILAGLRNRTFYTLAEANAAINERLVLLNNRFKAQGRLSSGAVEGLNLKAKLTIRKA